MEVLGSGRMHNVKVWPVGLLFSCLDVCLCRVTRADIGTINKKCNGWLLQDIKLVLQGSEESPTAVVPAFLTQVVLRFFTRN